MLGTLASNAGECASFHRALASFQIWLANQLARLLFIIQNSNQLASMCGQVF